MTENSSSDPLKWTSLWMDAQQKYWESWLDLSRQATVGKAAKPEEPAPHPWSQNFDLWAKLTATAAPSESREWIDKMVELNKGYLTMGEHFWKMLSLQQEMPQTPETWWNAVSRSFKEMQQGYAAQLGAGKDPWTGFATFWGMPLDTWRRVSSACSMMPGDLEKALRSFAIPGGMESPESMMGRLFSTPTLGYTREWQEEIQRWGQLWLEHGEALHEYGNILSGIMTKATELFHEKLRGLANEAKTPDTLRAMYDLWVDCGEAVYADAAMSPEFKQAQTRLVNTLMAVKRQEQRMVDEILSSLNMPTRRELDTSHRHVYQLQRQVWRMQETLDESEIRELREEVAILRRELEALRANPNQDAPKPEKRTAGRSAKSTR